MSYRFNPLIFAGLELGGTGGSPSGPTFWKDPVANEAALPIVGNTDGDARVTTDNEKIYVWDATTSRWVDSGITIAAFGSVPNSSGLSIGSDTSTPNVSRRTLVLQPADSSNPGAVSTTSQSFSGTKTFLNTLLANGGIDVAATAGTDTLTIGGTNADVVNIGRSGATINLVGTTINQQVTNLNVTDKNITLNSGGAVGSGATAGIDVEEAGSITGYAEVSGDRNSWSLKAPNTAGVATITPGASGITINQSSHDAVTLATAGSTPNSSGASLSGQQLTLQPADGTNPGLVTSGTQTIGGNKTFSGSIKSQTSLILEDPGVGTQTVTVQAPTLAGSYTLTLPTDDGLQYQGLTTDGSGALSFDYAKFSNAHYHVSNDGRSQYSSIQAAINAAETAGASYASPKFVFLHGNFTEDLTISKTGIFLVGEDSQLNQMTRVTGSLTFNKLSNTPDAAATRSLVYISSIFFNKASDNFITFTGTNPQRIHFQDCYFYASANSIFLADNTGTSSKVSVNNCQFLVEASAAKTPITLSAGWIDIRNSVINQGSAGGTAVAVSDGALFTASNTEITGLLSFTQTSTAAISICSITTTSGPAITTTSTNILGVAVTNCGFVVPAATSSVTGTGYLYHSNNVNAGLGGGFAATVAAVGLTSDTGSLRLPNRGTITLSETLANGQNTLTITPPASVAANLTYTVPDVGANANFVMSEGAQTINGAKTFSALLTAQNSIALTGNISSATYVDFVPAIAPTYTTGRVFYDSDNDSLSYSTNISGIAVHPGRENVLRVRNTSGAIITKGKAVYVSGSTTQTPSIALAKANAFATCQVIGIVQQDVGINAYTDIVTFGVIQELNTGAFSDGDTVYLSATTAGELTVTPPTSPNYKVEVGVITYAQNVHGKILVNPSSPSQPALGDVPQNVWLGLANNTANQSITGFTFAPATTRAFRAEISIFIDATSDLYAKYGVEGIRKNGNWELSTDFTGDLVTDISFNVTTGGQVQVSIGNITGFVSGSVHFRAEALSI